MPRFRRRTKLIKPRLQFRLTLAFLGMSTLALMLQFILFTSTLSQLAADLPNDGALVLERIPDHVLWTALVSFAVFLPITVMVGILVTFRVAGPVFRLERFLTEIIRGEKPADCRLRKGDELQELCGLLNHATAGLREHDVLPDSDAIRTPRGVERAA